MPTPRPDRIRLSPYARITLLKALRSYIQSLLATQDSERDNWPEAMDAWKIAKSLAQRPKGRRELWGTDWYYSFDRARPVADINAWIELLHPKPINIEGPMQVA